jgi:hypothetical protein
MGFSRLGSVVRGASFCFLFAIAQGLQQADAEADVSQMILFPLGAGSGLVAFALDIPAQGSDQIFVLGSE